MRIMSSWGLTQVTGQMNRGLKTPISVHSLQKKSRVMSSAADFILQASKLKWDESYSNAPTARTLVILTWNNWPWKEGETCPLPDTFQQWKQYPTDNKATDWSQIFVTLSKQVRQYAGIIWVLHTFGHGFIEWLRLEGTLKTAWF